MPEGQAGVCALVLAAGQGSRYREQADVDKLLEPSLAEDGSPPVLLATLSALQGVAERLVVVTRDDNHQLLDWLEARVAELGIEICSLRTRGLGHSLAQAAARYPAPRGWLVVLADMPYVQPRTFHRIAAAIGEASLIVPVCNGQRGNPRGVGASHRQALLTLDGERGAQTLFTENPVIEIEVDDAGVLQDIDRPADRR